MEQVIACKEHMGHWKVGWSNSLFLSLFCLAFCLCPVVTLSLFLSNKKPPTWLLDPRFGLEFTCAPCKHRQGEPGSSSCLDADPDDAEEDLICLGIQVVTECGGPRLEEPVYVSITFLQTRWVCASYKTIISVAEQVVGILYISISTTFSATKITWMSCVALPFCLGSQTKAAVCLVSVECRITNTRRKIISEQHHVVSRIHLSKTMKKPKEG